MNKETRETKLEKFGENDYVVTWWDGSSCHYKTLHSALIEIKRDFEENEQ